MKGTVLLSFGPFSLQCVGMVTSRLHEDLGSLFCCFVACDSSLACRSILGVFVVLVLHAMTLCMGSSTAYFKTNWIGVRSRSVFVCGKRYSLESYCERLLVYLQ